MWRFYKIILIGPLLFFLPSCDEGRLSDDDIVVDQEGGNARMTVSVTGLETWPSGYTVALAGFEDGNEYALISKNIDVAVSTGTCNIVLTGIPPEVSTIELCALDRLRRKVTSFLSADYVAGNDTVKITGTSVDLSMAGAIQRDIFNTTCIQCHGGSNYSAAGLNLTEGKSWDGLISVTSVKNPGLKRIQPGESASSLLYLILSGDYSSSWSYDHSVEVVRQEKLDLIRNWIDAGANPD